MITPLQIYLIESCDTFMFILISLAFICWVISAFSIAYLINIPDVDDKKKERDRLANLVDDQQSRLSIIAQPSQIYTAQENSLKAYCRELERAKSEITNLEDNTEAAKKIVLRFGILGLIFLIIGLFFPSTRIAREMYLIPPIVNSHVVQNIPVYLEKYLEKITQGAAK